MACGVGEGQKNKRNRAIASTAQQQIVDLTVDIFSYGI